MEAMPRWFPLSLQSVSEGMGRLSPSIILIGGDWNHEFSIFPLIYGMSSFPLTFIFFKMGTLHHQPVLYSKRFHHPLQDGAPPVMWMLVYKPWNNPHELVTSSLYLP